MKAIFSSVSIMKRISSGQNFSRKAVFRRYGTIVPFKLTDIGEGIKEVEILQMYVKEGQSIKQFENVCICLNKY